jgi:hypothetical protein
VLMEKGYKLLLIIIVLRHSIKDKNSFFTQTLVTSLAYGLCPVKLLRC